PVPDTIEFRARDTLADFRLGQLSAECGGNIVQVDVLVAPSLYTREPGTHIRERQVARLDRGRQIGLEFILVRPHLDAFTAQEAFHEPVALSADDTRSEAL